MQICGRGRVQLLALYDVLEGLVPFASPEYLQGVAQRENVSLLADLEHNGQGRITGASRRHFYLVHSSPAQFLGSRNHALNITLLLLDLIHPPRGQSRDKTTGERAQ